MNTRRKVLFLSAVAGVWPSLVRAQAKVPTVGLLWIEPNPYRKALLDAMYEKGYVENRNIRYLDRTFKEGYAQVAESARQLVQAKVDLIVAYGATSITAAITATKSIPIVMTTGLDVIALGWVASLAQPGGNVTGLSTLSVSHLISKRTELLKELLPKLTRVGVLVTPGSSAAADNLRETEAMARHFRLQTHVVEVHTPGDLERAFAELARTRVGALIVVSSTMLSSQSERIVALTTKHQLPAVYFTSRFVDEGGLMSYGSDFNDQFRRLATYIDRVLKGARAGELPIEQPTTFELVVNLKTAKALGITIPQSVLVRADRVIE